MNQGCTDGRVSKKDFELYLQVVKDSVDLSRQSEQWRGIAGAGGASRVAEVLIKAATKDAATLKAIEKELLPDRLDNGSTLDD
jgi:hypothetical protein